MKQTETVTGFTPGPWSHESGTVSVLDKYHFKICDTYWTTREEKEAEANARLIAAAPDLLEACKLAERHYLPTPILIALSNAITKATKGERATPH